MLEKSSLRQAGKELGGRLYKGPIIDAYNRLSQPSIPTRIEQILTIPASKEGFNTSASRFNSISTKLPGPGDYESTSSRNPSISKRSYLMAQASRFKKHQYATPVPGPGAYNGRKPKTPSSITICGRGKTLDNLRNVPAPGYYDPKPQRSTKETSSMFKSLSNRMHSAPHGDSPGPWKYNPVKAKTATVVTSPFVQPSNRRSEQINLYDPFEKPVKITTPGPADYKIEVKVVNKPSSMFLANEVDRFGLPVRRRKRDTRPGPGDYESGSVSRKELVTGAVFLSESKRQLMKVKGGPPGPAFYSPAPVPKRKSFHYKPDKIWA